MLIEQKSALKRLSKNTEFMEMRIVQSIRFSIDDQLFFETLKLQIRGTTIPYAAGKTRERIRQEKQIEEEKNILQKDVDEKHSPETNIKLKCKQIELQKI